MNVSICLRFPDGRELSIEVGYFVLLDQMGPILIIFWTGKRQLNGGTAH